MFVTDCHGFCHYSEQSGGMTVEVSLFRINKVDVWKSTELCLL